MRKIVEYSDFAIFFHLSLWRKNRGVRREGEEEWRTREGGSYTDEEPIYKKKLNKRKKNYDQAKYKKRHKSS